MSSRRSNNSGSGHRPSPGQSSSSVYSGYSGVSSVEEIVRPGTSAGPRVQMSHANFYSMPDQVGEIRTGDRVNRQPSSSSIPPYTAQPSRPPSYRSQTGSNSRPPSASGSSVHPASHVSDPPSYHSRPGSQGQGQGSGQQQQSHVQSQQHQQPARQQHLLPRPQQQQRPGFRQRTSERVRNLLHRDRNRR